MAERTLGQVAYSAWTDTTGGYPEVWEAAADAVVAEHERRRWQPIATAPKDGSPILGWSKTWVNAFSTYWTNEPTTLSKNGGWTDGSTNRDEEFYGMEPTHWQPVPEGPKEADAAMQAQKGGEG